MMALNESMNTTFVIVTHEMEVAAQMKKTIMLRDGYLVQPEEYTRPAAGGSKAPNASSLPSGVEVHSEGAGEVS
ncbi:ABC transporter related protein [Paenibacillus vortex V453]|nr:ABC transporter related protein [Paenibacillus vortex V453]